MGIKPRQHSDVSQKQKGNPSESIWNREITLFGSSFNSGAKEDFYSELSILLSSGIDLRESLELIVSTQKKKKAESLIGRISENVIGGQSLSMAMQNEKVFSTYEVKAIEIGEQTGQLTEITEELRGYFQRKNDLRRQLISSLTYPVIVLFMAVLVLLFMLSYVVPLFEQTFEQNRVELPWLTQKIVGLSHFLSDYGWIVLIVFLVIFIFFRSISKQDWFRKFLGTFQLWLPGLGKNIKRVYLIQFTQAMSLLTSAKIPLVSALHLTKEMIQFYPLQYSLERIEKDVIGGTPIYEAFSEHSLYDAKMIALLKVAEQTNKTEVVFQKLYERYSVELAHKGNLISNFFNLLLTLFVGLIVGVVIIAMYLPMFKMSSIIG